MQQKPSGQSKQVRCGLLRHLLVVLYDTLVVIALMMLGTSLVMIFHSGSFTAGKDVLFSLYLLTIWFLYLDWCWRHGGMTLGMRAWKVKLITDQGQEVDFKQSASRFGFSLLSVAMLGCGFLWSLFDHHGLTWHDHLSHSKLIRVERK